MKQKHPDKQLWIARDNSGRLFLYYHKPVRFCIGEDIGSFRDEEYFKYNGRFYAYELQYSDMFHDVTWKNSPKRLDVLRNNE